MSVQTRFYHVLSCCLLVVLFLVPATTAAQPHLRYFRLAEPPGGASRAHGVVANHSMIAVCGEVREDSLYRAALWNGYTDLPIPNWIAVELPVPIDTVESRALSCAMDDSTQLLIGGSFDGGTEGQPKPIVWSLDPTETPDPTGANYVLPTMGGAGGFGEVRSCGLTVLDDLYASLCAGWSRAPAGVQKAVVWLSDAQGDDFTLVALPDYGAGLVSQANAILDPCVCEILDPCSCEIYVAAGFAETEGGAILPQLWPPNHKVTLSLPVGAVGGVVNSLAKGTDGSLRAAGSVQMSDGNRHAVFWTTEDGMVTFTTEDLGVLDGYANSLVVIRANGILGQQGNEIAVGVSYNTQADRVATLFVKDATIEKYNLNDIITGTQPDLMLSTATGVYRTVRDGLTFDYVVGSGAIAPPKMALAPATTGDSHAYLVTNDLALTAVDDITPAYDPVRIVAYPNPCVDGTRFAYTLAKSSQVRVNIYDVAGRRVAALVDRFQSEGDYTLRWDGRRANGSELASGVYFARLEAGKHVATGKITLLK